MSVTVTVFGSSATQPGSPEYALAEELGALLAAKGARVCNGGYSGIMEAVSKGASHAGGTVIGVTCGEVFAARAVNPYVTDEIREPTLTRRMLRLVELGNAYVALPGSTGTLAEVFYTWNEMIVGELKRRPLVLLGDAWPALLATLKQQGMLLPAVDRWLTLTASAEHAADMALRVRR